MPRLWKHVEHRLRWDPTYWLVRCWPLANSCRCRVMYSWVLRSDVWTVSCRFIQFPGYKYTTCADPSLKATVEDIEQLADLSRPCSKEVSATVICPRMCMTSADRPDGEDIYCPSLWSCDDHLGYYGSDRMLSSWTVESSGKEAHMNIGTVHSSTSICSLTVVPVPIHVCFARSWTCSYSLGEASSTNVSLVSPDENVSHDTGDLF